MSLSPGKTAPNPFRDPPVSSNSTGSSSTSTAIRGRQQQTLQTFEPALSASSLTPNADSSSTRPSSTIGTTIYAPPPGPPPPSTTTIHPVADPIAEELPPAYTPTADVYHGESSVEFGPRRPFTQTAVRPTLANPSRVQGPSRTGRQLANTAGPSWTGYPGNAQRQTAGTPFLHVPPPPQHPSLPQRRDTRSSSAPASAAVSDFARDFYSVGADETGILGGSSSQYDGSPTWPANSRSSAPPPARTNGSPDASNDGRPTQSPVPGHPLLNGGKVLVYPTGYECNKCHNTGYKHYDPLNPCSKCWSKYAKAFTGPLTYAPWSPSASSSSAGKTLQRPLPALSQPPASSGHRHTQSLTDLAAPPPHPSLVRASSTIRPQPGRPGSSAYAGPNMLPIAGGSIPMPPYQDRSPLAASGVQYARAPPPGATVVRPGDPRIGGRLCWRCGGSGVTSFLIFDEQTCTICNGLGRTFG